MLFLNMHILRYSLPARRCAFSSRGLLVLFVSPTYPVSLPQDRFPSCSAPL